MLNANSILVITPKGQNPRLSSGGNHGNAAHWACIVQCFKTAGNKPVTFSQLVAAQVANYPTNVGNAAPFTKYAVNSLQYLAIAK